MSADRILFLVPTLGRRPELLRASLESIRNQQVSDAEIDLVLVSPEDEQVDRAAHDMGARVVRDPGGGMSAALNAGIAAALPDTEFFTWLGDDDLLTPGSLAATVGALRAHPGATFSYGWCDYVDEQGAVLLSSRAGAWADRLLGWGPNLIPQPGSLFRLATVVAAGALDVDLKYCMDMDLFLKVRRHGPFVPVAVTVAHFRWHATSNTVSNQAASSRESSLTRRRYMHPLARATYPAWWWMAEWPLAGARGVVNRRARRQRVPRVRTT